MDTIKHLQYIQSYLVGSIEKQCEILRKKKNHILILIPLFVFSAWFPFFQ